MDLEDILPVSASFGSLIEKELLIHSFVEKVGL